MGRAGRTQNIAARTAAGINEPAVTQTFPCFEIERATFALQKGTFVPLQSEPFEILAEPFSEFRPAAVAIQILDSQSQRPVARAATLLRGFKFKISDCRISFSIGKLNSESIPTQAPSSF